MKLLKKLIRYNQKSAQKSAQKCIKHPKAILLNQNIAIRKHFIDIMVTLLNRPNPIS